MSKAEKRVLSCSLRECLFKRILAANRKVLAAAARCGGLHAPLTFKAGRTPNAC